jgi:hypothetical protein
MLAAAVALLAVVAGVLPGFAVVHAALGIAAVALACFRAITSRTARIAAAIGAIECLLRTPLVHACLSPVFLAACVAMGLKPTGKSARRRSGLSLLIKSTPAVVFLQIILGASYRHKLIGVMPHLAGAMLVAGLLLIVGTIVLQRFPQLRATAGTLLGIVLLQVSLGITAFVMRVLDLDHAPAYLPIAVAHITAGSLTLAAATALAIQFDHAPAPP